MRRAVRRLGIVLASLVALVLVAAAVFAAVFHVHVGRGIDDHSTPSRGVQDLRSDYRLGIGSLELDLSRVQLPVGETHVEASVDVGDLQVTVPAGVALRVHSEAHAGYVEGLAPTTTRLEGGHRPGPTAPFACSCSTHVSAPSGSNGPYDEAACRCPPSRRDLCDERVIAHAGIAQTLRSTRPSSGSSSRCWRWPRAGIVLYLALWAWARVAPLVRRRARARRGRTAARRARPLHPVGDRDRADRGRPGARLAPGRQLPPDAPLSYGGIGLAALGAVAAVGRGHVVDAARARRRAPGRCC